ncbi:MAG: alkanesulfonate monooxygenase SsuD [Hyphomicrobiaceae bacterium]|jgi:alkanesulfonate monooxygenase SsuD/methylene tetrahydromethanopterin reductase-like flavin-dependent oxidoreductase (luciferase family)
MKLGVHLNAQHPQGDNPGRRFTETVEQVRLIRLLGFDSIWGGEHHITDGYHYFPLLPFLQRLSADAEGMEVGTNIALLPMHNPMEIAEVSAFLDVITGGKFQLGVGLGYRPEEFDMFGVPIKQRVSRMVEGIEIIRRLWTEDNVTHHGRHWHFENMTIRPQPAQEAHPPIIIAAQVDAAVERAAKIADGWAIVPTPRVDEISDHAEKFNASRAAAGLPPSKHFVRLFEVACARDEETALKRTAPYLLEKYAAYMSWGLPGLKLDKGDAPEVQLKELAKNRFGVGTPDQVIEALMAQHRIGITHVTMRASWPGMNQADILASLELIGTEVLPEVRRRIAAGE